MAQKVEESIWETLIKSWGLGEFRLVHDGQRNPGQFEFPPGDVKFYTKIYQLYLDGKPTDIKVKFKYDLRGSNYAGAELIWGEDGKKIEREEMVLANAKEVKSA